MQLRTLRGLCCRAAYFEPTYKVLGRTLDQGGEGRAARMILTIAHKRPGRVLAPLESHARTEHQDIENVVHS